jgi:hypothetical protein
MSERDLGFSAAQINQIRAAYWGVPIEEYLAQQAAIARGADPQELPTGVLNGESGAQTLKIAGSLVDMSGTVRYPDVRE